MLPRFVSFIIVGALLPPLVSACDANDAEPAPTITHGVWGLILRGCDTPDCETIPAESTTVFADPIMGTMGPGGQSRTDNDGMYQIELSPGRYHLSHSRTRLTGEHQLEHSKRETDVTIGAGLVKLTWTSGPEGGTWRGN